MDYTIEILVAPVFEELIRLIRSFTPENFNAIPKENSWTAGQIAQHILLSVENMPHLLNGSSEPSEREGDEKLEAIRNLFMDFGTKMTSPQFITPAWKDYEQEKFAVFFEKLKTDLLEAMDELDLSEICLDAQIPGFGPMTRIEFIGFVVYHTQRHIYQMREVSKRV